MKVAVVIFVLLFGFANASIPNYAPIFPRIVSEKYLKSHNLEVFDKKDKEKVPMVIRVCPQEGWLEKWDIILIEKDLFLRIVRIKGDWGIRNKS